MTAVQSAIQRGMQAAIERIGTATGVHDAQNGYYMLPRRNNLFGMVAMAQWDGFALGLATSVLGLCGKGDFPANKQREIALTFFFDELVENQENDEEKRFGICLWLLLEEATEDTPATLNEDQMNSIASILSFSSPRGHEAEKFLCEMFPNCMSLVPVFERKLDERAQQFDNPWSIISTQNELIGALRRQVDEFKSLPTT